MRRIYFDHAATSFPKPKQVPAAMMHYLTGVGSNVNRGAYSSALDAESVIFETREMLRSLFHGDNAKNVVLTANITTSLNILLKGLLRPGDHVLVSSMEHNAVMRPLQQLARRGISFSRIPCAPDGSMDLCSLPGLLRPETRAVITTHASNVCGTVIPVKQLGCFCLEHHLLFLVDAAQTAGLLPINMETMHIDALAFTGHKSLLGPQGTGGFLIREHMIPLLEPLLSGGTGSVSHTEGLPGFMPDRFEPGTPNIPGIYGLSAALRYLRETGIDTIFRTEIRLTGAFLEGLSGLSSVHVYGLPGTDSRVPVVSIRMDGIDPAELALRLGDEYGIQTRVGLHCAPSAHKTLGTWPAGTVRFSFGHTNTDEEIDFCLSALRKIENELPSASNEV